MTTIFTLIFELLRDECLLLTCKLFKLPLKSLIALSQLSDFKFFLLKILLVAQKLRIDVITLRVAQAVVLSLESLDSLLHLHDHLLVDRQARHVHHTVVEVV